MTLNVQPTYADVWNVLTEYKAPPDIVGESTVERNDRIAFLLSLKRFAMLEGDLEEVLDAMRREMVCPKEFSMKPTSAMKSRKIKYNLNASLKQLATASKSYFENLSGVLKKFTPSKDLQKFLFELNIDGGEARSNVEMDTSPINCSSLSEVPVHPQIESAERTSAKILIPPPQIESVEKAMTLSDHNDLTDTPSSTAAIVPEASKLAAREEPIQQQLDEQSRSPSSSSVSHVSEKNTSQKIPAWGELMAIVAAIQSQRSVPERMTESKKGMNTNDTNFSKKLSQTACTDSVEFMNIVDTLFGKHSDDISDVLSGHKGRNKKSQPYDYLYFVLPKLGAGALAKIGMTSLPDIQQIFDQYKRMTEPFVCIRFKLAHSTHGVPFFRKKMLESFVLDLVGDPRVYRFNLLIVSFASSLLHSRPTNRLRCCGR